MTPYVAFLWDGRSYESGRRANALVHHLLSCDARWQTAWEAGGLHVLVSASSGRTQTHLLPRHAGLIVGSIFLNPADTHDAPCKIPRFSNDDVTQLIASQGNALTDRYWGNYVAFVSLPEISGTWIITSPTGDLPCYTTTHEAITIAFATAQDIRPLKLPLDVNPKYLHARMRSGVGTLRCSAHIGSCRLRGGQRLTLSREDDGYRVTQSSLWSPERHSKSTHISDPNVAARMLRHTLRACTQALAADHSKVMVALSGGLDSSIIYSCLTDVQQSIISYTFYEPGSSCDPRPWARRVLRDPAQHVEIPLVPEHVDLSMLERLPMTSEPLSAMNFYHRYAIHAPIATQYGIPLALNGDGGDSGFGSYVVSQVVADHLRHRGLASGLWHLARQVAVHSHQTVWSVLMLSLRQLIYSRDEARSPTSPSMMTRLVSRESLATVLTPEAEPPPYLCNESAPALRARLGQLLFNPQNLPLTVDQKALPDVATPLYAQPVIELLQRIPSYVLFHDGRNPGLARMAFERDLPPEVVNRVWKDRAPGFFEKLIAHNRQWLRRTLLDGILVRNHFLDRAAVERALNGDLRSDVYPAEIFRHLDTELWARRWMSH